MTVPGLHGRTVPPVDSWVESGRLPSFQIADTEGVAGGGEPAPDERHSERTDRRRELGHLE